MNKTIFRQFFMILGLLFAISGNFARAGEFLDPDIAFQQKSQLMDGQAVQLDWVIAPGYNLYKDKIHVVLGDTDVVKKLSLPEAIKKFDKNFNKTVEVYHDKLSLVIPGELLAKNAVLKLQYQGCSDEGLCYSPIDKSFQLSKGKITPMTEGVATEVTSRSSIISTAAAGTLSAAVEKNKSNLPVDEVSLAQSTLQSGSLFGIALSFLGFGLLLAFTPCVLPMVPILSSIIVGGGDNSKPKKGFLLAVAYSLG
jgi:thioredoxin:protein disulfide reductase